MSGRGGIALLVAIAGCGGHPALATQGSCDIVVTGSTDPDAHTCTDYVGAGGANLGGFKNACQSDAATVQAWSDALCPHTGSVGGCQSDDTQVAQTVWYYAGTAAQWMMTCTAPEVWIIP
jgi:hypothetical protein